MPNIVLVSNQLGERVVDPEDRGALQAVLDRIGELQSCEDPAAALYCINESEDQLRFVFGYPHRGISLADWLREQIAPGCWVDTETWGEAVCTSIYADGTYGHYINIRYEAVRQSDGKTIWVANGCPVKKATFLRPADDQSRHVLTLIGPYGDLPRWHEALGQMEQEERKAFHGMRGRVYGSERFADGTPFIIRVSAYDVYAIAVAGPSAGAKEHWSWLRNSKSGTWPDLEPALDDVKEW